MATKNRFDPILHHATTQQDEAARQLALLLKSKRDAEAQLAQLQSYREEYHLKQMSATLRGVEELVNHQNFIAQLNKAMEAQQKQIELIGRQVSQRIIFWRQAKTRCDALQHLIDQQSLERQARELKQEQRENDEHGLRRGYKAPY